MSAPRSADGARVHAALIVVQLLFASLGTSAKLALRDLSPPGLVAIRLLLAAAVFVAVWIAEGRERVAPRDLARMAVYAFFGLVANQLLFVEGLARTTASNAVVLGTSIPVFTVGVAVLLRREHATRWKLAGMAVAAAGALSLTVAGFDLDGGRRMLGNALLVANSLSYAIYLVISRDVLERYRTTTVIAFTFLFGAIGILPFGAIPLARALPLPTRAWLAVGYVVIAPTVGTYFLNAWALRRVHASVVAVYIYLQPLVGVALAAAVLHERPGLDTALPALAIFAGIGLLVYGARRAA